MTGFDEWLSAPYANQNFYSPPLEGDKCVNCGEHYSSDELYSENYDLDEGDDFIHKKCPEEEGI